MSKRRVGTCVYCGGHANLTKEHVIPQCLYTPPLPSNTVTVGACQVCNNNKSVDDAYLRDYLVSDMASGKSPAAQNIRTSKVMRSVKKNRSEIAREIQKRTYRKPLYTPGGIYVGSPLAASVDAKRLTLSFERMVRGLYYHTWKQHLPRDYTFDISRVDGFQTVESWAEMKRSGAAMTNIDPQTFICQYAFDLNDHFVSRWLLLFYQTILIEVVTLPLNGIDALIAKIERNPSTGLICPD
jgi:hypothetical protein